MHTIISEFTVILFVFEKKLQGIQLIKSPPIQQNYHKNILWIKINHDDKYSTKYSFSLGLYANFSGGSSHLKKGGFPTQDKRGGVQLYVPIQMHWLSQKKGGFQPRNPPLDRPLNFGKSTKSNIQASTISLTSMKIVNH